MRKECYTCKYDDCCEYDDCYYGNPPTRWEPAEHYKPDTNADRIRAMSDYELAWEFMVFRVDAYAKANGDECAYPDTQESILEWLQQPATT